MEEKIITRQLFCLNLVVNCFYVLNEKIIFATNEVEINNIYTINVFKYNRKKKSIHRRLSEQNDYCTIVNSATKK